MFFAEALERHGDRCIDQALPYSRPSPARSASLFAPLHPRRVLRPAAGRACRASRTSRRVWMRLPIELLVLACLVVGIVPACTIGPVPRRRRRARCSASRRRNTASRLARLHAAAVHEPDRAGGGVVLYSSCCRELSARGPRATPLLRVVNGRAALRARARASSRGAGALARAPARHAPPAAAAALLARGRRRWPALCPFYRDGYASAAVPGTIVDPALRAGLDRRRRLRDRRRLAGQISPPGRADPDRRRRACQLHHLRLVLRARPRAHPAAGRDRHHRPAPARPALAAQAVEGRLARRPRRRGGSRCAAARDLAIAVAGRRSAWRCSPMRS